MKTLEGKTYQALSRNNSKRTIFLLFFLLNLTQTLSTRYLVGTDSNYHCERRGGSRQPRPEEHKEDRCKQRYIFTLAQESYVCASFFTFVCVADTIIYSSYQYLIPGSCRIKSPRFQLSRKVGMLHVMHHQGTGALEDRIHPRESFKTHIIMQEILTKYLYWKTEC